MMKQIPVRDSNASSLTYIKYIKDAYNSLCRKYKIFFTSILKRTSRRAMKLLILSYFNTPCFISKYHI